MMKIRFGFVAFLVAFQAMAQSVNTSSLPEPYRQFVPADLPGGLQLVELKKRCEQCSPWREINFYSLTEPARAERVTVLDGYQSMYAFPGMHYFANVKVERSDLGHYESDRDIVERALRHECKRKQTQVENYLAENPAARAKLETRRMPGQDYVEFESGVRAGIDFMSCTENVIGLLSSTISQVQIFVPSRRLMVTAYLPQQEKMNFKTIEEFRVLRDRFIEGYIDFLRKSL